MTTPRICPGWENRVCVFAVPLPGSHPPASRVSARKPGVIEGWSAAGGKPIRASRDSALWAIGCIDQFWGVRGPKLPPTERAGAAKAYEQAREIHRRIAAGTAP